MMTTSEFLQACRYILNILYDGFIFRIGCLGEKKNMRLARFSLHFARNRMTPCVPNVHGNHYTSTYFILLSDRLIFRNSLTSEKNEYMSQHTMRVSTCIFHVQLAESRPLVINNDLSHLGGYIYSIGLVKAVLESLQELVRVSSSSMLVTLNNV